VNYPVKIISLPKAHDLLHSMEMLVESEEYLKGNETMKVVELLGVLRSYGVTADTRFMAFDYSPGSTSVIHFLRSNLRDEEGTAIEFLSDWYAGSEVTGRDKIAILNSVPKYRGC